jgi:large subunit ribosomal protein L13
MDYIIDAKNKPLGRIASEAAIVLQGKKNPTYNPRKIGEDRVLLQNYMAITLSGRKFKEKLYHRHTGYMGHLKTETFEMAWKKDPKKVIRETILHMLPKNFLQSRRILNLVFVDTFDKLSVNPEQRRRIENKEKGND